MQFSTFSLRVACQDKHLGAVSQDADFAISYDRTSYDIAKFPSCDIGFKMLGSNPAETATKFQSD